MQIQPAVLVMADIGGYTQHNSWGRVNLAHAHRTIAVLLEALTTAGIGLTPVRTEGDAAVLWAPGADVNIVVDQWIPQMRHSLLRARERLNMDHPCRCRSCAQRNNLALRFVVHASDVLTPGMWGPFEPIGAELRPILKTSVPVRDYVLMTHDATQALGEPTRARSQALHHTSRAIGPRASSYIDLDTDESTPPAPARSLMGWLWAILKFEIRTLPLLVGIKTACAGFANLSRPA